MEKEKLKTLLPLNNQIILRKLGMFSSSYMGNDIYFLIESINLIISDIGEEFVSIKYKEEGKDWNKTKEILNNMNKISINIKTWYDAVDDKKFNKKDVNEVQRMFKKFFFKTASKVSLIQRELYDLFIFLVKNTTIQRSQIPNDAFKIIEHTGFRKIDLTDKHHAPSRIIKE